MIPSRFNRIQGNEVAKWYVIRCKLFEVVPVRCGATRLLGRFAGPLSVGSILTRTLGIYDRGLCILVPLLVSIAYQMFNAFSMLFP